MPKILKIIIYYQVKAECKKESRRLQPQSFFHVNHATDGFVFFVSFIRHTHVHSYT